MSARRINIFLIPFLLVIFLVNASIAKAQDAPSLPPDLGNSQVQKATGAAFREGWNFFTLGFDGCNVKNILDELQADGGTALNVANLFVKEDKWQPYSFLSSNAKDKKIGSDKLLAFNSNQNFFLEINQKNCLDPDSQRQAQIENLREGGATKQSVMAKIGELPFDLWTKLTNLVNVTPSSQNTTRTQDKQTFDNLTVSGKLTVNDLGITGKISSGLLSINGLNETLNAVTINTLGGDLYFQNNSLGGVNILSGKVTIDKNGNLKVMKLSIDTSEPSSSSLGLGTLQGGVTSLDVYTSAVSQNSKIFVTPTSETGGQPLIVKSRTAGTGFKVIIEKPYSADITFDWLIIN